MLPLIFSTAALFSLGAAWFFAARASKDMHPLASTFIFQAIGIPFFLLFLPWIPDTFSFNHLLPVLLIGVYETFVMILLFYAMKIGNLGVVLPITDGYAVFTLVLSMLFLGELPTFWRIIGALLLTAGITLISVKTSRGKNWQASLKTGVVPALLVAAGTGVFFFLTGIVTKNGDWFSTSLGVRLAISATSLLILTTTANLNKNMFSRVSWKWLLPGAGLDVLGFALYNKALVISNISYATFMISAQTLVTVLLCFFFLREKIEGRQWAGILMAFFGLLLLQF